MYLSEDTQIFQLIIIAFQECTSVPASLLIVMQNRGDRDILKNPYYHFHGGLAFNLEQGDLSKYHVFPFLV